MQTRITTRVIIYKDNKILLSRNVGKNYWYPGGGGLEDNENLIECAIREVAEETGQKVKIIDLMYVQEFYFSDQERSIEFFYLASPTLDSKDNFNHTDTDDNGNTKIEENRWFTKEEIENEKVKVFPEFIKDNFWKDIEKFNEDYNKFFMGKKK